jgi:hypothetical protein
VIPNALIRAMIEEKARLTRDAGAGIKDWCRLECRTR